MKSIKRANRCRRRRNPKASSSARTHGATTACRRDNRARGAGPPQQLLELLEEVGLLVNQCVEVAVARGKDRFDKRHAIKERDVKRDLQRTLRDAGR